jgi:hypothetical protein
LTNSGDSQQGEGSGGRGLADVTALGTAWSQPGLIPPDVVQATLRIAYIPETHHAQWQLEVQNPVTGELLAMSSVPHRDARSADHALSEAFVDLRRRWGDVCDPDPF